MEGDDGRNRRGYIITVSLRILYRTHVLLHIMEIYSLLGITYSKPAIEIGNYMFKVNNRITRARCEIYSR